MPCQVYATFQHVQQLSVTANATASFAATGGAVRADSGLDFAHGVGTAALLVGGGVFLLALSAVGVLRRERGGRSASVSGS